MTSIPLLPETLKDLAGKVVVITGSANGIGAATVKLLHQYGSLIVHGDWDEDGGEALDASLLSPALTSTSTSNGVGESVKEEGVEKGEATFIRTDVTSYDSILALFDLAWNRYGRVDIAISNAGITEVGNWFGPHLDLSSVKTKPPTKVLDVNLTGSLYFAHIACVYLSQPLNTPHTPTTSPSPNTHPNSHYHKSLILLSSTAGFKSTPNLPIYTSSKHGILGLLRSLRTVLPTTHNIKINAICPWMTDTSMVDGIRKSWLREGLPVNRPEDVARVVVEVAFGRMVALSDQEGGMSEGKGGENRREGKVEEGLRNRNGINSPGERYNGRAVFVEGGRGWDIEEGIEATEVVWLGREVSKSLASGQEVLGDGAGWRNKANKA